MNPLKPVRFYGSALPRPRFLDDASQERVDPPVPVNYSLLRWAKEANWSMGGLSLKRQRMQGKIEGRLSKLKHFEGDDESPKNAATKSKTSRGKGYPDSAVQKSSPMAMRRKGNTGVVRGRHGKGAIESPLVVVRRSVAIHPISEWGEEDGPTPRRVSPRLHASTPLKPVSQSSRPIANASPSFASIEFPVRRRQVERALPEAEDSDSDVDWEEFSRLRDRPLRSSSRVTSIRRSFKEFALASDFERDT